MTSKKHHEEHLGHRAVDLHSGAVSAHKPSIQLQYLRYKVEKYLHEFGFDTQADKRGDYVLVKGHTAIFLSLSDRPDGTTFVDLATVLPKDKLPKVKDEATLYKALLKLNVTDELGKFGLFDHSVQLKYRLLGNDLDRDELGYSVLSVLGQAEHLEERVQFALNEKELAAHK
jgi:hypothetical protein